MKKTASRILAFIILCAMLSGAFAAMTTVSADTPTQVTITFTGDEADKAGFAQSSIIITPGDNAATTGYYLIYYTDGSKTLSKYDEIATVAITGSKVVHKIKNGAMIPEDAKGIAVFESSTRIVNNAPALSTAVATADIPASKRLTLGTPDTKFGAVSDVHMNYEGYSRGAYAKWANALTFFSNWGAEYIIVTGDMTGDRGETPDLEAQYEKYNEIVAASPFPANKIYEGIGNHGNTPADAPLMDQYLGGSDEVHPYTNSPYYHVLIKGGSGERDNLYIFMAQEITAAGESSTRDNFSKTQIDWVEGLLNQYGNTDTNIFIIEHAPFLNYGAGDKVNGGYTSTVRFDAAFPQTMRLKALLSTYKNAIVMSGHTHVSLYDDVNYSDEYNEFARTVHVGSTCQPCGYGGTGVYTRNTDGRYEVSTTYGSEAYTVEIYDDYIVYTGYNLSTGKIIPAACIIMPTVAYGGAGRPAVLTPDEAFHGKGTAADPYIIADEEDFLAFTNGFNASTSTIESEMYGYGKHFLQVADLDMSNVDGYSGTAANGNAKCHFAGSYNGGGHTITVAINDVGQRSVFPYNYGLIYNLKISGSIIAEGSAQPIRTSHGGIVNCIFDLTLYADKANGICYSNYAYMYNVYTYGTVSGETPDATVLSNSSTDYVNMYHYHSTSNGAAVTDENGTRTNNLSTIASAFNARGTTAYNTMIGKAGDITLLEVSAKNGELVFEGVETRDPIISIGANYTPSHTNYWKQDWCQTSSVLTALTNDVSGTFNYYDAECVAWSNGDYSNPLYIDLVLDAKYSVSKIAAYAITCYDGSGIVAPETFTAAYSLDGISWTAIQTATVKAVTAGKDGWSNNADSVLYTITLEEPIVAKYIQYQFVGGKFAFLNEIEAYGKLAPETPDPEQPHVHDDGKWITLTDGSKELRCTECGEVLDTEPAPEHPHVHDDGEWITLADGSKELRCTECGEVLDTEPAPEQPPVDPDILLGDVNNDGFIDMFDYLMVKSFYFEVTSPVGNQFIRADMNEDGIIDMFDYLMVKTAYFNS